MHTWGKMKENAIEKVLQKHGKQLKIVLQLLVLNLAEKGNEIG